MGNMDAAERARFDSKYEKATNGCHLWNGPLDRDGYGVFYLRGATRRAHRAAWFDSSGEISEGYVVNHTCRNRHCVNPQHLQAITVAENTHRDSSSIPYINSQKTACPEGHPYDGVEKSGRGRSQRVCLRCRRQKQAAAAKRRYAAGKASLSV